MNRIFRVKATKGYTIVPNVVFQSGLSLRAIGLLTYILHLPDDWVLYKSYLYDNLPDGRDAIKTAWAQLEDMGFIVVKKTGGGKGKLPETNYFIYDSPKKTVDIQPTETRRSETRPPTTRRSGKRRSETKRVLITNEQSTNEQTTIPVIPDGITGPPPEEKPPAPEQPKKEKKKAAAPNDKELTIFQRFTASYDAFFRKLNGVPPQYGKASGAATNSLVAYFKKIAKDRATKDQVNDPGESYIDDKAHEGWEYVLDHWDRLDGFLQTKTRLIDINSNIPNIITQLKNGHSKKQTGNSGPTGGNVSTASLAQTIAAVYGGTGQ